MKKVVPLALVISILILGVCQSAVAGTLSPKVDDASSDADPHPSASSTDSNSPLGVVKQSYAAFGRGDIPAIVNLVADQVDWQDVCSASLPYAGLRRNREEVAKFFSESAQVDENKRFGPNSYTCSRYKTVKLRAGVASSIPLRAMGGSLTLTV